MAATIRQRLNSGLRVIGFVDDNPRKAGKGIDEVPVLGTSLELPQIVKQHGGSLVVLAITHEKSSTLLDSLARLPFRGNQYGAFAGPGYPAENDSHRALRLG